MRQAIEAIKNSVNDMYSETKRKIQKEGKYDILMHKAKDFVLVYEPKNLEDLLFAVKAACLMEALCVTHEYPQWETVFQRDDVKTLLVKDLLKGNFKKYNKICSKAMWIEKKIA